MSDIVIKEKNDMDTGWIFDLQITNGGILNYEVKLYEEDWQRLTGGNIKPEELTEKSFEFLLKHEPKESILKKFNLVDIGFYFPEYEEEIKGHKNS